MPSWVPDSIHLVWMKVQPKPGKDNAQNSQIHLANSTTGESRRLFTDEEQLKLAMFFEEMDQKGAKMLLSNSDPKNENQEDNFFEEAYCKYEIYRVKASRAINSKANKRGKINELIIPNYPIE